MGIISRFIDAIRIEQGTTALVAARAEAAAAEVRSLSPRARADRSARDGWVSTSGGTTLGTIPRNASAYRKAARLMVDEVPHAAKAVAALVDYGVGFGIRPASASGSKQADRARNVAWIDWAETSECDWEGRSDFYGLQALARYLVARDGECLARLRYVASSATLPLRVQILSCDHLDGAVDKSLPDGGAIVGGVEFDSEGRRVAYHLLKGGVGLNYKNESVRIPAAEVVHLFRVQTPGQARGVTELSAALDTLRDHADGQEAWLVANRIAACFQGAIELSQESGPTPFEPAEPAAEGEDPRPSEMSPGTWIYLRPGEKPHALNPPPVNGQEAFQRLALLSAAAALGVPYHIISADVSQANYSSLRAAMLDFGKRLEADQWRLMIPGLCVPIWREFCRAGVVAGLWRPAKATATWHPPKLPMVDPQKDVAATREAVRSGLMTWPQAVAEQGYDPEAQLAAIKEFNAQADAAGVVLDSDPRKTSQQGQTQKPGADGAASLPTNTGA